MPGRPPNPECEVERELQERGRAGNWPRIFCCVPDPQTYHACCREAGHEGTVHVAVNANGSAVLARWNARRGRRGENFSARWGWPRCMAAL